MIPQFAGVALVISFNFFPVQNFKIYPKMVMDFQNNCLQIELIRIEQGLPDIGVCSSDF